MAHKVEHQGDILEEIEENVVVANDEVEEGGRHLLDAKTYQKKKGKMIIPCAIGLIVAVIVIIVLVVMSKQK